MHRSLLPTLALLSLLALATDTRATERRFTYSYEATTIPKGSWEYEQWFTWKSYDDKDRFDFRHEFEYGITDSLTLDIYLANWRYEDEHGKGGDADYKSSGFSLRHMLTDPNKSGFGTGLYGEVLVGDQSLVLEGKLLLQKNFGPLIAVYNLVIEAEWEGKDLGNLDESVGVWENTFGLSYQVTPNFFVGMEALHEVEFEEWSHAGDHVLYVGPNISFRKGSFFATVTGLFQATNVQGEANTQLRVIAGITF